MEKKASYIYWKLRYSYLRYVESEKYLRALVFQQLVGYCGAIEDR